MVLLYYSLRRKYNNDTGRKIMSFFFSLSVLCNCTNNTFAHLITSIMTSSIVSLHEPCYGRQKHVCCWSVSSTLSQHPRAYTPTPSSSPIPELSLSIKHRYWSADRAFLNQSIPFVSRMDTQHNTVVWWMQEFYYHSQLKYFRHGVHC